MADDSSSRAAARALRQAARPPTGDSALSPRRRRRDNTASSGAAGASSDGEQSASDDLLTAATRTPLAPALSASMTLPAPLGTLGTSILRDSAVGVGLLAATLPGGGGGRSSLVLEEVGATGDFRRMIGGGGGAAAAASAAAAAAAAARAAAEGGGGGGGGGGGDASAASTFLRATVRSRLHGGWLGNLVADAGTGAAASASSSVSGRSADAVLLGLGDGETLYAPASTMISIIAKLSEGLLSGSLLVLLLLLGNVSSNSVTFMNTFGASVDALRMAQFVLSTLAWVGAADQALVARTLLAAVDVEVVGAGSAASATAVSSAASLPARERARASLVARSRAIFASVLAHSILIITVLASMPYDNRLRVVAATVPAAGVFSDVSQLGTTTSSDVASWSNLVYIRFAAAVVAVIATNSAAVSPTETFKALRAG